ncbi:MAG: tetratricopeptide repeat protein [Bacteroidota bacterium]
MQKVILLPVLLFLSIKVFSKTFQDTYKVEKDENEVTQEINDLLDKGITFYQRQINYDSAYVYFEKARILAEKENLITLKVRSLNCIAAVHYASHENDKAILISKEILELAKLIPDSYLPGTTYNNLGIYYHEEEEYTIALKYLDSALSVSRQKKKRRLEGLANSNIGMIYHDTEQYREALPHLKIASHILDSMNYHGSGTDIFMAKSLFALGKLDSAERIALKRLRLDEGRNAPEDIHEISILLSSIYAERKDTENQVYYLQKALTYNDSLAAQKDLSQIEISKLKEIRSQQEKELEEIKTNTNTYRLLYILLGISGVILLSIFIARQFKLVRFTKDIRNVQRDLIKHELDKRKKKQNRETYL